MKPPVEIHQLFIELTNSCNFRCGFCPMATMRRQRMHIPLELFRKTVDDVVDGRLAKRIGLHCLGEPMLHPRLCDAIDHASSRGLDISMTTNGSLLTPQRVRELADAGLNRMIVSLVTDDEREHAFRHAKPSYADYYAGILEAIGTARREGSPMTIGVRVMSSWTRRIFDVGRMEDVRINHSVRAWRSRMASLAVDLARACGHELDRDRVLARLGKVDLRRDADLQIVPGLDILPRSFGDWGNAFASKRIHPVRIGYCPAAARTMTVLSNGTVIACCLDYDGHTPLGNVRHDSLSEIVRSPTLEWMMSGFDRVRVVNPACQRCLGSDGRVKALAKGLATIALFKLRDPIGVPVIDLGLG